MCCAVADLECVGCQRSTTAACGGSLQPKEDSLWCVAQAGSPLPAPEPFLAPAPDGSRIIAMAPDGCSSWPSALAPAALNLSRETTDCPGKAMAAQASAPGAPALVPSPAAATPALAVTQGSSLQPSKSQPAAPATNNAAQEPKAVSYPSGRR